MRDESKLNFIDFHSDQYRSATLYKEKDIHDG